jgi:hypothetical protein
MVHKLPSVEKESETPIASVNALSDIFDFVSVDPKTAAIDLTELKIWPPHQGQRGGEFPLWAELRFAEQTILTVSWRVTVHLTRAEISTRFVGCSVAPGTRYGDNVLAPSVGMMETEFGERDVSRSGKFSSALSTDLVKGLAAGVAANVGAETHVRSKKAIERKSEINQHRVSALPNDRWEIIEPRGRLRGTYLVVPASEAKSGTPLCRVAASSDHVTITLSLEVRPQDIDPEITPLDEAKWTNWSSEEKPNKSKIAKLLIAKACTECFVRPADERITLALAILQGKRWT